MKFIKNLTEHDFSHVNGNYMAPIVAEMLNPKRVESPSIMESEIMLLEDQINEALDRISDLYLKPGSIKGKSSSTSSKPIPELKATFFNSRITQ